MDISSIAQYSTAQKLQSVKAEASAGILSKSMKQAENNAAGLIEGMKNAGAKNAELSVSPQVGSQLDVRA